MVQRGSAPYPNKLPQLCLVSVCSFDPRAYRVRVPHRTLTTSNSPTATQTPPPPHPPHTHIKIGVCIDEVLEVDTIVATLVDSRLDQVFTVEEIARNLC